MGEAVDAHRTHVEVGSFLCKVTENQQKALSGSRLMLPCREGDCDPRESKERVRGVRARGGEGVGTRVDPLGDRLRIESNVRCPYGGGSEER